LGSVGVTQRICRGISCALPHLDGAGHGALNWGILGITGGETNVLAEIFGTGTLTDVVYVVIGVAALMWVPRLLEAFHLGRGPHPHGV
jgi:uncharacterized membrane protein YuzA (DUF378 family)